MHQDDYTVLDRFLHYVSYDTQSERDSDMDPSSAKQLLLAEELVKELRVSVIHN